MAIKIVHKAVQTTARKKPNRGNGVVRFHKLVTTLGPERLAMVESRLMNGETGEAIAKTIKMEWGLMTHQPLASIAKTLTEYRRLRLFPKLTYLQDPKAPALSEFAEKVDVLSNLTRLVEIQQVRVTKGLQSEQKVGGTLPTLPLAKNLRYEVELLAGLYKQLSDLQMDLGLLRKVPTKLQIEGAASRTQQSLEDAMQRNRRVDEALTKAFAVLDGKYQVVSDAKTQH